MRLPNLKTPLLLLAFLITSVSAFANCPTPAFSIKRVSINQIELRPSAATIGSGFSVSFNSSNWQTMPYSDSIVTITGLFENVSYALFIRQICTPGDTSSPITLNFTTPLKDFIYLEDGVLKGSPYRNPDISPTLAAQLESIANQVPSAQQERGFLERTSNEIQKAKKTSGYGNLYFENEKAAYPTAMYALQWGMAFQDSAFIKPALTQLMAKDIDFWNYNTTDTIDLFPCFTLKGQVNKYFYFGKFAGKIKPGHMQKMNNAFRLWTYDQNGPRDPLLRPHPNFQAWSSSCYTPQCRDSWVDTRTTDNLTWMRNSAVYLFSEEIGNDSVKNIYKRRIKQHVASLYHTGFSEWDSENYLSHTYAPILSLYTYTTDPETKLLAKAALDWYSLAGALKYYRGMFAGPSKRLNTGSVQMFGGAAAPFNYLYFGNSPMMDPEIGERDLYTGIITTYRPPQAVYDIADGKFKRKIQFFNTKPPYGTFNPVSANRVDFYETMYYGTWYHLGSAVSSGAVNDARPFNSAMYSSTKGAEVFFANFTDSANTTHSKLQGVQIAQNKNVVVMLRQAAQSSWFCMTPTGLNLTNVNGYYFAEYEKSYVAIRPINLSFNQVRTFTGSNSKEQITLFNPINTAATHGVILIYGDEESDLNFPSFQAHVLNNNHRLDLVDSLSGTVVLGGSSRGFELKMQYNSSNDFPIVYRDSKLPFDYQPNQNRAVYNAESKPSGLFEYNPQLQALSYEVRDELKGPVYQAWKQGTLTINTDNQHFTTTVDTAGNVTWSETAATPQNTEGQVVKINLYANGILVDSIINPVNNSLQFFIKNLALINGDDNYAEVFDAEGNRSYFNISETSGSRDLPNFNAKLYPNPSSEVLNVEANFSLKAYQITGIEGRVIQVGTVSENQTRLTFKTSDLKPGTYIIQLTGIGGAVHHQAFVKR